MVSQFKSFMMNFKRLIYLVPAFFIFAIPAYAAVSLTDAVLITNDVSNIYACFHVPDPNTNTYVTPPAGICAIYSPADDKAYIYIGDLSNPSSSIMLAIPEYTAAGYPSHNIFAVSVSQGLAGMIGTFKWFVSKNVMGIYLSQMEFAADYNDYVKSTTPTGYFALYVPESKSVTIKYIAIAKLVQPYPITVVSKEYTKEEVYNEPPTVNITSPAPESIVGDTFYLRFTATDPEGKAMTCYYSIDDGTPKTIGSVTSGEIVEVLITNLYIGRHKITVTCYDPYEAVGSATIYVINEKPPITIIAKPSEGELVTTAQYTVAYYVGDDRSTQISCQLYLDGNIIDSFVVTVNANLVLGTRTVDFSSLTPGQHNLRLTCTDESNLNNTHTVYFDFATDPDQLQRYCEAVYGEWYTDHCCGDDPGEVRSFEVPAGYAFNYTSCTMIELTPGQCDDVDDCIAWGGGTGWYCTNQTFREHRIYTCQKEAGALIGSCVYVVDITENCTELGTDYFCSYGMCVTQETIPVPAINITYPANGATLKIPFTQKEIPIKFAVIDQVSDTVICNVTYDSSVITLRNITANGTEYTVNIPVDLNKTSYSVSVSCENIYNQTNSQAIQFYVNYTAENTCEVDSDCGVDGWYCVSSTTREYRDYYCDNGVCKVTVTQTEVCPAGTYCYHGQCVQQIACTSDADCPADEWVCVGGDYSTSKEYRDWYCDTSVGYCKYNITQTVECPSGTLCVRGTCVEPGSCPGPTYVCIDNETKSELVWVYDDDLKKCIGVMLAPESCPTGVACVDGKCGGGVNVAPRIELIEPTNLTVQVGETVTIKFKVSDDNTLALLTRVYIAHSPSVKIFEGYVTSGQEQTVTFTPESEGTYTVTIVASDGYGSESTYQTTIQAVSAPAPTAAAAAPAPAAPPTAPGVPGVAYMPAREIPWYIAIPILIGVGILLYYLSKKKAI